MVVKVVDDMRVATFESKHHAPVRLHRDRPKSLEIALQWMQMQSRRAHVSNRLRLLEHGQDQTQSAGMCRLDAGSSACLVEALEALVDKRLDHGEE